MSALETVLSLKERMGRAIIGQEHVVERLLLTLLCNGNLLLEGLPGLAKTPAVRALAGNLEAYYRRIQFTPDLLPSDITGTEVYYSENGEGLFKFDPGPIFANLVLADEINRAPAKVQAALLEAMEERQVTVAGVTHDLPPLFMVLATQNPIEQEGTYPLPEAQMDRFLMHIMIRYPDLESEVKIIGLVRGEEGGGSGGGQETPDLIPQQAIFDARAGIRQVQVAPAIDQYIAELVRACREGDPGEVDRALRGWLALVSRSVETPTMGTLAGLVGNPAPPEVLKGLQDALIRPESGWSGAALFRFLPEIRRSFRGSGRSGDAAALPPLNPQGRP